MSGKWQVVVKNSVSVPEEKRNNGTDGYRGSDIGDINGTENRNSGTGGYRGSDIGDLNVTEGYNGPRNMQTKISLPIPIGRVNTAK